MASLERQAAGLQPAGAPEGRDAAVVALNIQLEPEDYEDLFVEMARVFNDQRAAERVVRRIGFDRGRIPAWTSPEDWWDEISGELAAGAVVGGVGRLLAAVVQPYPANRVFARLAAQYGIATPTAPAGLNASAALGSPPSGQEGRRQAPPGPGERPTVHVIFRTGTEEERAQAAQLLRELHLEPEEAWSTAEASSYRVNADQAEVVRRELGPRASGWIVVPPGEPDYLLRQLFVQGPDGRRFRLIDAPAQQTVSDVASSVVERYGPQFTEGGRPTVVDRVGEGGQGQRLDPDQTLHDAGIQDGDNLRVGFEATAGVVNPIDRRDALARIHKEILDYADAHEGFRVEANSVDLPTEYVFTFRRDSFGPPEVPGGDPVVISLHEVLVQLDPGFPDVPPAVFWLTPIFHPNVYPNYDSEEARLKPGAQGHACLGLLAESYLPSRDFGEVCQLIVDIAAYQNYDLFEITGAPGPDGLPAMHANFYNLEAAKWAVAHQDAITAIHGRSMTSRLAQADHYPNVVEPVSQ